MEDILQPTEQPEPETPEEGNDLGTQAPAYDVDLDPMSKPKSQEELGFIDPKDVPQQVAPGPASAGSLGSWATACSTTTGSAASC